MTLQQMIVDLADSNLDGENGWYRWKEISRSKLPLGVSLPEGNRYAQNVALKLELHRIWSISNPSQRFAIAKYYVSTWGGVPKNNDETLTGYVTQEPDSVISRNGKKGVASWSKVLCIRDPKKYAIFDARVSTALNCLQIIGQTELPKLLPLLPGRNKTIKAGAQEIARHAVQHHWDERENRRFYDDYLGLIRNVARSSRVPNTEIYTIEMLLFAQAECLLSAAFPNAAVGK
jgi:hypothetical protein